MNQSTYNNTKAQDLVLKNNRRYKIQRKSKIKQQVPPLMTVDTIHLIDLETGFTSVYLKEDYDEEGFTHASQTDEDYEKLHNINYLYN